MMPVIDRGSLTTRALFWFRVLFVIAAFWNFAGAIPGLADTAGMFEREFGRALTDPVMIAVYRGAWGIVLMGGLGKALFALNLLNMHLQGWTSSFSIVVIAGDVVFVALFGLYFLCLKPLFAKRRLRQAVL
jgi:hypothetical protein